MTPDCPSHDSPGAEGLFGAAGWPGAWRALFTEASTAMALLTPDGTVVAANRALAALLDRPELPGQARPLAELLPADDLPGLLTQLQSLAAAPAPTRFPLCLRCRRGDGSVLPGVGDLSGPLPACGGPVLLLQLHGAWEGEQGGTAEVTAYGVALLGLDAIVTEASSAFARLLDYRPPDLVGRDFLSLLHPEDGPAARDALSRLITGVSTVEHLEQRHLRRDGREVWVEVGLALERDAAGQPLRLALYQQDISARRQALEALLRKHDMLARIVDTCPVGLLAVNAAGLVVFANEGLEQVMGTSRDEILGRPYDPGPWEVKALDGTPLPPEQLASARVRAGEGPLRNVRVGGSGRDGRRLFLNVNAAPILSAEGAYDGMVLSLEDITERLVAESALRDSEQRYREVVDNANSIIIRCDLDWRMTFANEYAQRFFGYSEDELVGSSVFDTIVPATESTGRDLRQLLCEVAAEADQYGTNVNENVTADGRRVWVAWSNRLTRDASGEVTGLLCVGTDLTELRAAGEELREQEERYRTFLESTDDAVFLRDENARYLTANRAMVALLGLPDEQIIGRTETEVGAPGAGSGTEFAAPGAAPVAREVTWDGRAFEIREFPVRLAGGQVGVGGYIRDITDRQRAADNVRLAAVGQLAGGVAHDFNNMLTALKMRADLTRGASSLEAYRELINLVMDSVNHGAKICRSLMDFARPEEPCRTPLQVEACLDAAVALIGPQLETAGVSVHRDFAPATRPVLGDDAQLRQVFVALLTNACHAMPQGGDLRLATLYLLEESPSAVVVSVADNGTGIPPENLRRIFEPFFTTKGRLGESEIPGSGLGLAAAHGIITAHGGTIEVSSELGRGTTFQVRLPLGEAPAAEAPAGARPLATGSGRSAHILIADDDTGIRNVIGQILELAGHRVTMVARAGEALEAVRAQAPDLAIIDLMMPGGGRQVLEAVRLLPDPPPVALITGRLEPAIHRELIALGASVCIPKPFGADILLSVVDELLRGAPPARQ